MGALRCVSAVTVFDEPTPLQLIEELQPVVYMKSSDYSFEVLGKIIELMAHWSGVVAVTPYYSGFSTSEIIERIRNG